MSKGIVVTSFSSQRQVFSMDHEMGQPYLVVYSVFVYSVFLNATANDMAAKTEKSKVLHYFKACFNVLTSKNNQLQT